jgi:hypothetical protein
MSINFKTLPLISALKHFSLKDVDENFNFISLIEIFNYLTTIMFSQEKSKRELQLKKLKEWEICINKISAAAHISVENDVDLDGPPSDMTYINDIKPAKGIVIPDDPPMGCECSGKNSFNLTMSQKWSWWPTPSPKIGGGFKKISEVLATLQGLQNKFRNILLFS